jgi:hypothetical protein
MGAIAPSPRAARSLSGLFCVGVGLLLAFGCSGKVRQAGGLEISVSTDMPTPDRFDTLGVDIEQQAPDGGWGSPLSASQDGGSLVPGPQYYRVPSDITLPTTISVAAGTSPYQEARIAVSALKGGANGLLVQQVVETHPVPTDRIVYVTIALNAPDAAVSSSNDAQADDATASEAGPGDATVIVNPRDGGDAGPTCVNACTAGQTRCNAFTTDAGAPSYASVETCQVQSTGCTRWVKTSTCGVHQSCQSMGPAAGCTCNASACSQAGTLCQDAQTLVTCAQDADGCFFVGSAAGCPAPKSCSGMAPGAACSTTCMDSCAQGQTLCVPGGVASCTLGANGCRAYGPPVPCGTHQICAGAAGAQACTCAGDPLCNPAAVCVNATTLAVCSKDSQNCAYASGMSTCANGACSGGACCTNACTNGTVRCANNAVQVCNTQASGCTAWSSTACGGGAVCERVAAPICSDPNWAEWPMPNGQTDVSAGAPNLEAYTNNGDGTVSDNVTGLIWQQTGPTGTYSQASAAAYCTGLNLGGLQDWRLPSMIELLSLVDLSVNPTINATYFPGTMGVIYWSSTPTAGMAGTAWVIKFSIGLLSPGYAANGIGYVRCVR